jgi:hypothetical protein
MLVRRPAFPFRFAAAALLAVLLATARGSAAQRDEPSVHTAESKPASFDAKTRGLERRDGLLTTFLDRKGGRLLLELPAPAGPRGECGSFLYLEGIRTGLGSNPVGLDRGQSGGTVVVTFRRVGARVLLEQQNLRYRAQSPDSNEVRSVRESFAPSVLWAGEVQAETPEGHLLVDFTPFLVRDAHGVAPTLKANGQGAFSLDKERSALDPSECLAFPDNLEFEAVLTFAGDEPGREVRETAAAPRSVTITQHHSLVRLPDAGYRPRAWDPRSGSFDVLFADYARPIGADLDVRLLVRHRLEKIDPAAARSRVKKPIVYYVDPGAPEPIRSALVEGASWWAKAFDAAGFIDAFQVKLLPPGVDPLDVRYNVIQWVHRATRGWSYGGGVVDPRTGEMLKGQVTLGSLRIRQDRLIFEGLAGTAKTGTGDPDDPIQLSLARIRQLAAHEVGHTLGFEHNFAASTFADRASVMDYPAPTIGIRPDGTLDFSNAYATGIGAWDVQQVRYAYTQFASDEAERAGLAAILAESRAKGYRFISDADTRPAGAAHPLGAMWDNGADPIAELAHEMDVRRVALARFGEANVAPGSSMASLEEVLAPLYFHHRYQLEAAAKSIGGLDYSYAVRGDGDAPPAPVSPARQRAAIEAVLGTLDPAALDLPESVLRMIPPPPTDLPPHHEGFGSGTSPVFDALGAAATAADLTLSMVLPPERLARLVDFHRRDPASPGVQELLAAITQRVFVSRLPASHASSITERKPADPAAAAAAVARLAEIRRVVQAATVRRLLQSAAAPGQTPVVRAALESELDRIAADLALGSWSRDGDDRTMHAMLSRDIRRALDRRIAGAAPGSTGVPADAPPGPPIGAWSMSDDCEWVAPAR